MQLSLGSPIVGCLALYPAARGGKNQGPCSGNYQKVDLIPLRVPASSSVLPSAAGRRDDDDDGGHKSWCEAGNKSQIRYELLFHTSTRCRTLLDSAIAYYIRTLVHPILKDVLHEDPVLPSRPVGRGLRLLHKGRG